MAVIDASVWIARYKTDDKFHEQAKQIIQSLNSNQMICIPAIAFTEVAGVIKRTSKNNDDAWNAVLCMKDLEPEVFGNFDKLEPIATEIAIKYGIRGADAYYLAVAEMTKSHLYTFDKQHEEVFEAISKNW
jgi:predicted nucleic acid-binding protein